MGKVRQRKEDRKNQIIETALRLAENTPFDDISITDICKAVNISVGGFYYYFNGKSDLLIGFFNLIDDYMAESVFPLLTSENELENLKTYFHGWAVHVYEHGVERAKLLNTIAPVDYDSLKRPRPIKKELIQIIARGQEKGQFPQFFTADKFADLFLIGARGVVSDWARRDGPYSIVQSMDDFIEMIMRFGKDG